MASIAIFHRVLCSTSPSCLHPKGYQRTQALPSQFLSSNSLLKLKKQTAFSTVRFRKLNSRRFQAQPSFIYAVQSNFLKVIQTVWRVGKDGIDAGTNLVPDSIPRPLARISVTVVAVAFALFLLKSFLSTAFFALATMGVIYFAFIALNKDESPRVDGKTTSVDESLEEARRIMDKYK
nr:uncharacterized protein LOC109161893 [Ipomoea trifida]